MSRRRRNRTRPQATTTDLLKAPGMATLPAGVVPVSVQAILAALQTAQPSTPLPRPDEWSTVPFGPGRPLPPAPINELQPGTNRPMPRRYDYPVSANLPGVDLRLVPWKVLRDAADKIGLIRQCIEFRKARVAGLGWDIAVSEQAVESARREHPDASDADLSDQLRDDMSDDIDRIRTWWEMPDRTNGLSFADWMTQVMEEHLVLDAIALYPRMTVGGDLFSLEVLDGSTIKPLLDERGNRPASPYPAYQQVLQGFPRGEFTATATLDPRTGDAVVDGYLSDQLVYARRSVRTWTPYGHSAVERALADLDLWMKRQEWMRAEYDDGVMPASWIETDAPLQPGQLREYQTVINDELSSYTRERHRFHLLPKGFKIVQGKDAGERYRPEYDEYLLKLVCGHFGVMPSQMGFVPGQGLGGTGHQQGEEDTEDRQTTRPQMEWLGGLLTQVSRLFLDMPRGLEFKFLGLDAEDEAAADALDDSRYKSGRVTLNETRDRIGKPRFDFPEADMPFIVTSSGVVFLEGKKDAIDDAFGVGTRGQQDTQLPGQGGAGGKVPSGSPQDAPNGQGGPTGAAPSSRSASGPQDAPPTAAETRKAEELKQLRRYLQQRGYAPARPFVVEHLTLADIHPDLRQHVVVKAAEGGDASREGVAGLDAARPADRPAHGDRPLGYQWPAG